MHDAVVMSVAFLISISLQSLESSGQVSMLTNLWSFAGGRGLRTGGCAWGFLLLRWLARAANSRGGNVIGIYIDSKVLQRVDVPDRVRRIALCHFNDFVILASQVIDDPLADFRHMQDPVKKICRPEYVQR